MKDTLSYVCESILLILIAIHFIKALFSENKAKIWSPISVIALTYVYYCSIPFWKGTIERYYVDEIDYNGYLFHVAALLSYICILLGFSKKTNVEFSNWNSYFTPYNVKKYGITIFIIAMVGYTSYRGFHFSIAQEEGDKELITGGLTYYFVLMINMCAVASTLILISLKNNWKQPLLYMILFLIFIQIIFAGARWMIITVVVSMLSAYYLYPKAKRINILLISILGGVLFLGFSIMDTTRSRGRGINIDKASTLSYDEIKDGAQENYSVYWFSLMAMNRLDETGERVYFQPFVTAALMPIPRSLFPWKPDAAYVHKVEDEVFGKGLGGGAAFLNFVEYYMAFGWVGIIVVCYILGWIARMFWDNYENNKDSIGAIVALGAFSAVLYSVISRGYLAGTLPNIVLVVFLPFWLTAFLGRFVFNPEIEE